MDNAVSFHMANFEDFLYDNVIYMNMVLKDKYGYIEF